jgi:hypothetical protein
MDQEVLTPSQAMTVHFFNFTTAIIQKYMRLQIGVSIVGMIIRKSALSILWLVLVDIVGNLSKYEEASMSNNDVPFVHPPKPIQ